MYQTFVFYSITCCVAHFNCRNFSKGMSCTVTILFGKQAARPGLTINRKEKFNNNA